VKVKPAEGLIMLLDSRGGVCCDSVSLWRGFWGGRGEGRILWARIRRGESGKTRRLVGGWVGGDEGSDWGVIGWGWRYNLRRRWGWTYRNLRGKWMSGCV